MLVHLLSLAHAAPCVPAAGGPFALSADPDTARDQLEDDAGGTFCLTADLHLTQPVVLDGALVRIVGTSSREVTITGGDGARGSFHVDDATVELEDLAVDGQGVRPIAWVEDGSLTLTGVWLRNGAYSESTAGGGMLTADPGTTLTVMDSRLEGASSTHAGGCVRTSGALTVRGSVFSGCVSEGGGGAIFGNAGVIDVRSSRFHGNATSSTLGGGAILSRSNADARVEDSWFIANSAPGAKGQAIALQGVNAHSLTGLTVLEHVGGDIGTVFVETSGADLDLEESVFCGNEAVGGAGLGRDDTPVTVRRSLFALNVASGQGGGARSGGNNELVVRESMFIGNQAAAGAAIFAGTDVESELNHYVGVAGEVLTDGDGTSTCDGLTHGTTTFPVVTDAFHPPGPAVPVDCAPGGLRALFVEGPICDATPIGPGALVDADLDDWPRGLDCAPDDDAVHPEAPELCNGIDDDCDGLVDELDDRPPAWVPVYADVDGDGAGAGPALAVCAPGAVHDDSDCDDGDAAVQDCPDTGEGDTDTDADTDSDTDTDTDTDADTDTDTDTDADTDPDTDTGAAPDTDTDGGSGALPPTGCTCDVGGPAPGALLGLTAILALRRRRTR